MGRTGWTRWSCPGCPACRCPTCARRRTTPPPPKDEIDKNTYEVFELANGEPTFGYELSQDELLSMEWRELELENDDLKNYKAKAEYYVRQHQDEAVIAKLKGNVPLTPEDVAALERILWSEVGSQQDYEAEIGAKPLGEFVRDIPLPMPPHHVL